MSATDRPRDDAMAEVFRKDPAYAMALLNSILEDGAIDEAMVVLRQMSKAYGGISQIAEKTQLSSKTLYRTLSNQGNPLASTLFTILRAMGLRLTVQPLQQQMA